MIRQRRPIKSGRNWAKNRPRNARAAARARTHPIVTAVFVGGRADGLAYDVPAGRSEVIVTMVDGTPKVLPTLTDPEDLMNRAKGTWEMYAPIKGLIRDGKGRMGYWVTRALPPSPPDAQAGLISDELVAAVEHELLLVGETHSWDVLRGHLAAAGYILAVD